MAFKSADALSLLQRACERDRLGHAYLITGPEEADLAGFATKMLNLVSGRNMPDLDTWEGKRDALVIRPESKSRRISIKLIRDQVEPFLFLTTSGQEHRFCIFLDAERMTVE